MNAYGFRHCHGENIQVYTACGKTHIDAVRKVIRGLRKLAKETGREPRVTQINVTFIDDETEYMYSADAYVDESSAW